MVQRETLKQVLVPSHFQQEWNIIPNRVGDWERVYGKTINTKLAIIKSHQPDIVVSGDCMAAIAAQRVGLDLVWLDAHGDYHTLLTTESGQLGGMPLAMLCGRGDLTLLQTCAINPREVYHLGGSDFDFYEKERMLLDGVNVSKELLEIPSNKLHLHIDTDVISSLDLSSSIHPAKHGVRLIEFWDWMRYLLPKTVVLSIKTYCPQLDTDGVGEQIVLKLLRMYHDLRTV